MSDAPSQSLWHALVRIYQQPGVEALCLRLQDEAGANVNLLLYALYCGSRGVGLPPGHPPGPFAVLADSAARIRQLRRAIPKTSVLQNCHTANLSRLRGLLARLELCAESQQITLLSQWQAPRPESVRTPVQDRHGPTRQSLSLQNLQQALSLSAAIRHPETAVFGSGKHTKGLGELLLKASLTEPSGT